MFLFFMIAGQRKNEVVAEVSQKNKDSLTIDFQLFNSLSIKICKELHQKWTVSKGLAQNIM
ncbi:hypothetical protein DX873_14215 [Flagellimonas nanhaiensis]|uniref:Uncharacterized protein n=1 Tax=Flagellimonas nanhaiensis TaxID=2292706 RepID=A0A371JNL6_9FLAO|nr:hypothetical protein DX873_14215 [Allomuricauda nanhaiensis]